ncbi:PadR family transcriptional regulator [Bacillaceae bacterium JMAK1]|nr:PadR family transcriptional regulator [Bacillaceae bacterium JMAK1]
MTTKLMVLALLGIKPMSGYDIKEMLKLTDAERWSGILIGSIYNAIHKLERDGYIEVSKIEHTGHRQKAIYTITKRGQEYEKELIRESLEKPFNSYPTQLYSGLSFVDRIDKPEAIDALNDQKAHLDAEYSAVTIGFNAKEEAASGTLSPLTRLVFDHMFKTIELQQAFVQEAIDLLKSKES